MNLLLFDLDGTLLRSNKTISAYTQKTLKRCRDAGHLIGVSTSRSEHNCMSFLPNIQPDILICSGGAIIKYMGECVFSAEFSVEETQSVIRIAREVCGQDCEITVDTVDSHFWNYKNDPNTEDASWGKTIYDDFNRFEQSALKVCVQIFDADEAAKLAGQLTECDCVKFSDGPWYKFTKKEATKENAILTACKICDFSVNDVIAFGDDLVDIRMLQLCGIGVAMGNAVNVAKELADEICDTNDNDGVAKWLESHLL